MTTDRVAAAVAAEQERIRESLRRGDSADRILAGGAGARDAALGRRNPYCSKCGDLRGGPYGHETNECSWNRAADNEKPRLATS